MKKLMILSAVTTVFAACQTKSDFNGVYVAHLVSEYSIADDTLIVKDSVITKVTGFRKIRHGDLRRKEYATKVFRLNSLDAPVIQFGKNELTYGKSIYRKLP